MFKIIEGYRPEYGGYIVVATNGEFEYVKLFSDKSDSDVKRERFLEKSREAFINMHKYPRSNHA